jgi:hypothetical protein
MKEMKEKRKRKGKIERQAEGVDDRKAKSERERERGTLHGDQIWQTPAYWAIVFFGQFL